MQIELIDRKSTNLAHHTPLLFVHGAYHAAWCWDVHFLPYFADRGYHACAMSLRGHGTSAGREALRRTSLNDFVDDLAETVQRFETPPVLIGHSLGATITQRYLEYHTMPAAIIMSALVRQGSAPPKAFLQLFLRLLREHPRTLLKSFLTREGYYLLSVSEVAHELFYSPATPHDLVQQYVARMQPESARVSFDVSTAKPVSLAFLSKTPILFVGGADDSLTQPHMLEAGAQALQTEVVICPNVGHNLMLEPGWQVAADTMIDWLRRRGL
ncbi:MAG: alpha/beta fold hydrolase [Chloroflexi bacterium AL-W]|nr:alpha/beta fold hydrolase [Chloroflexi bacterium AL-N1]NOK65263.1 alpha/beta fold hydrolase [Chloroflexi bacterium AL-N10]NOK72472.1 alpha/beta fold hydrolase [Chloroflexi bacterium AL-N5]NOK79442.1 alpha/beta fold hydrolase [Chloroflexi bacterium AL-W]NOK87358.1 alpha/beta fold hydrolase [Chloroflexi bacterium AL-N15]